MFLTNILQYRLFEASKTYPQIGIFNISDCYNANYYTSNAPRLIFDSSFLVLL